MRNEQTDRITEIKARVDEALAASRLALQPFRRASALAGIRAIRVALGSLERRIEADEDVTSQIRAIAGLVLQLERTLGGGR